MKHLILCLLALSPLSLFAQNTINPTTDDTGYLHSFAPLPDEIPSEQQHEALAEPSRFPAKECLMIIPLKAVQIVRISPFRFYAGYATAFSRNDALKTSPGFEIGASYTRHLFKRVSMQAGLGYVMRNQTLRVSDAEFALRNERWSASLLLHMYPNFKWQWARRFSFKAGLQVDFFDISSPFSAYDAAHDVHNRVVEKNGPELFAVGELYYNLRPNKLLLHSISIAYMQGVRSTFHGEVLSGTETLQTYGNKGSYLSVRYSFQLRRRNRY